MLKIKAYTGILLYILLLIPPIRQGLETVMAGHMLVQIPALIYSGYLVGQLLSAKYDGVFEKYNAGGVAGILLVIFLLMYWMLPKSLDAALDEWPNEVFKFLTLPLLVGIPLADSWKRLGYIFKAFVILNAISMFGVLSWLYLDSPTRVCNNYLPYQQIQLGHGFLILIAIFSLPVLYRMFFGHPDTSNLDTDETEDQT